ncbi:MAG: Zn-ribbon domain-containing OB-fold protein [Terriglobia bacterium]
MSAEPKGLRGTPLELADFKKGKVFTTAYVPRIRYAWDTGAAIGRYLEELKNGRLIARRCHNCQRTLIPPRMFCERCFRPTDEWVYVKDTGRVNTFSLCYVSWDVRRLKQPEIPAVIEIDAASPGMGIMHLLGRVKPKAVRVGMRVRAVWKPAAQRTGSITDILYFEPVKRQAAKPPRKRRTMRRAKPR